MSSLPTLISKARANIIKIDPQARVFSDTELSVFLNEAQNKLATDFADELPEQQKKVDRSINAGQQEYLLNTVFPNYKKINYISMQECDIAEVSDNVGDASEYCIYGTTIYTNTIPSTSKIVKAFYASYLPEITMSIDCVLSTVNDLALAYYTSYLALLSVEKNEKAMGCLQTYQQTVARLITDNNRRVEHNFINYNY